MSDSNDQAGLVPGGEELDLSQRFERSLDFWVEEKEDYPPAIRGAMAEIGDLPADIQQALQRLAVDSRFPQLSLKRLLWFEDKNDKLDEASAEAREAFRPFAVTPDGLISTNPVSNPILQQPTRHRLVVSDQFAAENYERDDETDTVHDADDNTSGPIGEKSWRRKITQTLKPWSVRRDGRLEHLRPKDDLLLTLNELFSRTQHGWLVVDLVKLRQRRGAILTYARTFEYQRKDGQAFEFKLELFGLANELARFHSSLENISRAYFESDEQGQVYLTKASVYLDAIAPGGETKPQTARKPITIDAKVELQSSKPSQVVVARSCEFYQNKLKPLITPGKRQSHKIDLRQLASGKAARFDLRIELDAPLLVATSGDAVVFQLDDMLNRFAGTKLNHFRS
jgi:hypothetical protein